MTVIADLNSIKSLAFIRRQCWINLFIVIALFGLLATQATAASFDCSKAASWVEKTVCANPELSKLDEDLAKAYSDALASLSPEGQKETKQYQKQWPKELSHIKDENSGADNGLLAILLKIAYEERIQELKQSLIKFPDHIFRNVHVMHLETKKKCPREIITKKLTYPQMENQRDKNEKFQNTLIFQKASDDFKLDTGGECTDVIVKYIVSFSNKHLISFQGEQYYYVHGAAHGYSNRRSFSWLLEGNMELQAADLFDDKTGWRKKLVALASQKLKEQEVADKESYEIKPSTLMDMVTSPSQWVISKGGLGFQFGEYDFGGRTTPFLITIDWKTLDPFISKYGHSLISD